jgi:4-amino-4-deoxy-L-arabinose transferase-like glycosyltransferase
MQMAAPLAIGLLGWYAWYETDSKFWLYDIYFFTGLATLAKGPVAPFLVLVIIAAFAFLRREWSILRRSFWWPGMLLYFAMVLPWFIAVQHQNPTFFREFFLEHNLARFATNRHDALDGHRHAGVDRRHSDFGGRVAAAPFHPLDALRQPPRRCLP